MFKSLYRLLPQRTLHKRLGVMSLLMLPAHSLYAQTSVSLPSLSQDLINIVLITILTSIMLFKAYKFKKDAKDAQQFIWHQAHYDPQTELPNRTLFYAQLKDEIKLSRTRGVPIALLFIDLDLFKEVNDQHGHPVGDQLLSEVALRLKQCIRPADKVARLGGDEFTIILTNLHDLNMVKEIANKILVTLSTPFEVGDLLINITSSIGSTIFPNDSSSIKALMKNADMAMYESKSLGKNCFQPFSQSMQDLASQKKTILNDLKTAVREDEFDLVYQPILNLKTNTMVKAEALIRWKHPDKGVIQPNEFIQIAETSNLIPQIGDWAFKRTLKDTLKLQQKISSDFSVSLNVSPKQLSASSTLTKWPALLKIYGLAANSIGIEITEGLLLESNPMTSTILNNLRSAGAQLLIDDFGTGYSSLSYLKKLDADFIKIDQSFVENLSKDSEDMVLCETIILMAHKLGLMVIAEGIETTEQRDLLLSIGCDYGQGYLFSKPKPLDQLIEDHQEQSANAKPIALFA